jgi:hypothetical protein
VAGILESRKREDASRGIESYLSGMGDYFDSRKEFCKFSKNVYTTIREKYWSLAVKLLE